MRKELIIAAVFLFINSLLFGQEEQTGNKIQYIDTKETMAEQLEQFKGKVVYVDLWATFCSPCIKMFKYKKAYDDYFAENDIAVLCLCIDDNDRKEKWKELIHKHEVSGYHVFVDRWVIRDYTHNLNASKKCRKSIGNGFPRFMIIDKNGEVVDDRAWGPCEKMVKDIEKYLD